MFETIKKVLHFIVEILFITSKIYPAAKQLSAVLGKVGKISPIKKENSWRDKL